MKKIISVFVITVFLTSILAGCASSSTSSNTPASTPKATQAVTKAPDAVSSASLATDEANLLKATSKDGTWIIALKGDMITTNEIVIDGSFTKADSTDNTKMVPAGRKLALYNQDANRNKTDSYTLTAPRLTVKSIDTNIWGGTFVGDVYVEASGFNLVDAKVQGNIYFKTAELKASFKMDSTSSVTGVQEVKS